MSKYVGMVADQSWKEAFLRLPFQERKKYELNIAQTKYLAGLDVIFKCGRLPRVYNDELKKES